MSIAYSPPDAVERISRLDPTFTCIDLEHTQPSDSELTELIDCLLAHPNVITELRLDFVRLTDEIGIKLARYVAASSTIQYLDLAYNEFSSITYLALAAALRINTSLLSLDMETNPAVNNNCIDKNCIDAAFVDALLLNPNRPVNSRWALWCWDDFHRLKKIAEELGHPSMQALLAITN